MTWETLLQLILFSIVVAILLSGTINSAIRSHHAARSVRDQLESQGFKAVPDRTFDNT